jgi:hypothetical protein
MLLYGNTLVASVPPQEPITAPGLARLRKTPFGLASPAN